MKILHFITSLTFFTISISAEEPIKPTEIDDNQHWSKSPPKVTGSAQLRAQVEAALEVLKNKTPEVYALIQEHVAIIAEGKTSGMWAYRNPPTFEITSTSAAYSITWCAGIIAHDAYHSKLYHDYLRSKGPPVPDEIWTGAEAEKLCIQFQLSVLRKIGAPDHEIEYCRTLNGEHFDVNKSGKNDWDNYFKRNW
jgi:hypothetical protein